MLNFLRKQLASLYEARTGLEKNLEGTLAAAEKESRGLNDAEKTAFDEARAALKAHDDQIADMEARVSEATEAEARKTAVEASRRSLGLEDNGAAGGTDQRGQFGDGTPAHVVWEPGTYDPFGQRSYFKDLVSVSLNRPGSDEARENLFRSAKETRLDAKTVVKRDGRSAPIEVRALTTTDGAGGDFVPPLWMVQEYIQLARAARPTADRVRNMALPTGTDSINIPRLATGTAVAEQASQNTAVQQTDPTTNAVSASVTTIAGGLPIAVQLIEQSPLNMDEILLQDLALDYAAKVDLFVLNNNAAGKFGLLQQAGTTAVAYTDATPTVGELYSKLADATQQIYTGRYLPPDTIVMHPRRWAWFMASLDTQGRPLLLPQGGNGGQGYNALGVSNGLVPQGAAGNIAGIEVIVDPNLPVNLGAGTNQDPIVVMRAQDSILWEGTPNAEAFRETKADQLTVFLRFYRYVAFTAGRYVKSTAVINGTGLVPPVF